MELGRRRRRNELGRRKSKKRDARWKIAIVLSAVEKSSQM